MAVVEIDFEIGEPDLPPEMDAFLKEADRRCDLFFEENLNRKIPRYLPGNAMQLFSAMDYVTREGLTLGDVFCEWGSGLGIGVGMACLMGYEAYGIEIQPELVKRSRALLSDFDLKGDILCTSYLPPGFSSYEGHGGHVLMGQDRGQSDLAYEDMAVTLEEVDLFYVYPWPEEQEMMLSLFDSVAVEGALLIAFFGYGDVCLFRKE